MAKEKKLNSSNYVDVLIVIFFIILIIISFIPLLNIFSLSISDKYAALANPGRLFPDFNHISLIAYISVFRSTAVYKSLFISLAIVICATIVSMVLTLLTGFAVSNNKVPGRGIMMTFVLITILFGGGLIPTYLTYSKYGLIDNFMVLVLPGAINGYNVILIRNHITNIPKSLLESAEIDGANPFVIMTRIVLPLCIPVVATIAMFNAIGKWNDWSTAYIYIYHATWLRPFQNVLQDILVNPDTSNAIGMDLSNYGIAFSNALIIVSLIPIVGLYLCTQKYLIKGLFIGSVKE